MGRTKDSLKHQLRTAALQNITDNASIKAYRRSCDAFAVWGKEQGVHDLSEVSQAILQRYADYLASCPEEYTAATIHGKLAPICKAAGVNMSDIRKPKRTAGRIRRGRSETRAGRGEREAQREKFRRLVALQQCTGIRRAELARLTGADLIEDEHGGLYIHVKRGKGGKEQLQYIIPKDRETVEQIFRGIGSDERVFTDDEMRNHINLHRIRAEHAQECYRYYCDILAQHPEASEALRVALIRRWENGHTELKTRSTGRFWAAKQAFIDSMDSRPYRLRGENREKASLLGLPEEYNRLALMAVSVFHLSHWRLDVTVVNYLIQ